MEIDIKIRVADRNAFPAATAARVQPHGERPPGRGARSGCRGLSGALQEALIAMCGRTRPQPQGPPHTERAGGTGRGAGRARWVKARIDAHEQSRTASPEPPGRPFLGLLSAPTCTLPAPPFPPPHISPPSLSLPFHAFCFSSSPFPARIPEGRFPTPKLPPRPSVPPPPRCPPPAARPAARAAPYEVLTGWCQAALSKQPGVTD